MVVAITHDPCLSAIRKPELLVDKLTVLHQVTYSSSSLDEGSTHSVDYEPVKVTNADNDSIIKGKERRVQFAVDENDVIQPEICKLPEKDQDYCKEELHWSRLDLKHMAQRSRKVGKWIACERPDLVHSLHRLYNVPDATTPDMTLEHALRIFYESAGRGLERHVAMRISDHRRWAIRSVIAVQAKLKQKQYSENNSQDDDMSDEDVERLLSIRAATVSQRSLEFAQFLGSGDAAEAHLIYQEFLSHL